jgi:hypothetical protein
MKIRRQWQRSRRNRYKMGTITNTANKYSIDRFCPLRGKYTLYSAVPLCSTMQLLLPACQQEMYDSSTGATGSCRWNYSHTSAAVSSVALNAAFRCVFRQISVYCWKAYFLYESYVKCGSARNYRRKIRRKFLGHTDPSTGCIHELIKKVRSTGSLLDKKPACKNAVFLPKKN